MPTDFSTLTLTSMWTLLEIALKCLAVTPEDVDFETIAKVAEERSRRKKPMPQLKVHLRKDSELGRRFQTAYKAARVTYPQLPKLIGWKGDGVAYVPTYEKRFGRR